MSIQVQGSVQSLYGAYAANEAFSAAQAKDRRQPVCQHKDAVVLSQEGRTFGEIFNRLKADGGKVREDKVAFYEKQIESGNYNVAALDIADRMINQRF